MGIRFRRSMKLMPGVRLNFSASGIGMSVGAPGARMSISPSGRVTRTIGLPGTGLYDVQTVHSGAQASRRDSAPAIDPNDMPPKPGFFAQVEREFWHALNDRDYDRLVSLSAQLTDPDPLTCFIASVELVNASRSTDALLVLRPLWTGPARFDNDRAFREYGSSRLLQIEIASGVTVAMPFDGTTVGFYLAEVLQEVEEYEAALQVLTSLPQSQLSLLSTVDLLVALERWSEVLQLTDGIANIDDATALILTYRGMAFRETGSLVAAQECLASALRARSRAMLVRHRALAERALLRVAQGEKAKARADVERIRADDHDSAIAATAEARIAAAGA